MRHTRFQKNTRTRPAPVGGYAFLVSILALPVALHERAKKENEKA